MWLLYLKFSDLLPDTHFFNIVMNLILWILSMCKLRRLTHKLSKAYRAYVKFVSELQESTHR